MPGFSSDDYFLDITDNDTSTCAVYIPMIKLKLSETVTQALRIKVEVTSESDGITVGVVSTLSCGGQSSMQYRECQQTDNDDTGGVWFTCDSMVYESTDEIIILMNTEDIRVCEIWVMT